MMEKVTRRSFIRATMMASAGIAGAAVMSACAPQATPAPAAPAPTTVKQEPTAAPAAAEPITLQLHMRAGGEVSEAAIYVMRPKEFMEANPNIKVELAPIPAAEYFAKILTLSAAGTLGDCMFDYDDMCDHSRHVRLGLVATVDEHLDAAGISKSEWLPSMQETLTYEGKMYGLPKSASSLQSFIVYNADMFDAAGIAHPPTYGSTFEGLAEWAQKLTKGSEQDREVFGYAPDVSGIYAIYTAVRALGSYGISEDGKSCPADGPEWYEMARWTAQFSEQKLKPAADQLPTGGTRALFAASKLAAYQVGRWEWKAAKAAVAATEKPFKWDIIEFPRAANAKGWRPSPNIHEATTASKHPDEAFKLVYALADKRQAELMASEIGYLTARVDDSKTIEELTTKKDADEIAWLKLQYECQMKTEKVRNPFNLRGSEVDTATKNSLDKLWLGVEKLTPDFMKQFKAEIDAILAKPDLAG